MIRTINPEDLNEVFFRWQSPESPESTEVVVLDNPLTGFFKSPTHYTEYEIEPSALGTSEYSSLIQLLNDLSKKVTSLHTEINKIKSELQNNTLSFSLQISTLNDNRLSVIHPISITAEETRDECLAIWPEINVSGIGSVLSEAIADLKKNIVDIYFSITTKDKKELGKIAIDTFNTLKTYLSKK